MTQQPNKPAALVKKEEQFKALSTFLAGDGMKKRLAMALPKHMTPDRMVRIALSAASRSPLLLECTTESLALSLIRAAEFGVETDGWEAHLVPYYNGKLKRREAQLIVDYKGLTKLAYQSELVLDIQAAVVREGDLFEYEYGTESYLKHIPANLPLEDRQMTHAWAVAKIKGGGTPFVVLNQEEVMSHKKSSAAADSDFSPWNNPATEPAMWRKTAVRALAPFLPRSATLREVLKHEDAMDRGGDVIDGVIFDAPSASLASDEGASAPAQSKSDAMADRLAGKRAPRKKQEREPEPETLDAESNEAFGGEEDAGNDDQHKAKIRADYDGCKSIGMVNAYYTAHCGPEGWVPPHLIEFDVEYRDLRKAQLETGG